MAVRERQRDAIKAMLGSGDDEMQELGMPSEPSWKVLVYDRHGQDILSPLFTVAELRALGVTLYLQLASEREPIPDTTVVYFVLPTPENVSRICKDLEEQVYDKFQLNFISAIPREVLEQLANATVVSQSFSSVERVFDMYSNFISLESDMFTLKQREREEISYAALNAPVSDAEMTASLDTIVNSLFCVLVSLGMVPIIRCSQGHAAEHIARKLDQKLRDHLKGARNGLFTKSLSATGSFQRPLLALIDRSIDFSTILHHTWTYQALVQDLLSLNLNRVTYKEEAEKFDDGTTKTSETKTFEFFTQSDTFWAANRGLPFPEVAEAVEAELAACKRKEDEIRNAGGSVEGTDNSGAGDDNLGGNTAKIRDAVATLPKLLEQKRQLREHMSVLMVLMNLIKKAGLDAYYRTEVDIMKGNKLEAPLIDLIGISGTGRPEDKIRLFVIYLLSSGPTPEAEKCEAALIEQGCDMRAVVYAKDVLKQRSMAMSAKKSTGSNAGNVLSGIASFSKSWLQGGSSVGAGPTTQIVDALMQLKNTDQTKDFLYLDPKQLKSGSSTTEVPQGRAPFDEAIAFMVGGGNYAEYQNLVDHAAASKRRIAYGCSELVSPDAFLAQMASLKG